MGIQLCAQQKINYNFDHSRIESSDKACNYALVYKSDSNVRMDFYDCDNKKVRTQNFEPVFNPLKDNRELFYQGEQLTYHNNGVVSSRFFVKNKLTDGEELTYDREGKISNLGLWVNGEKFQGGFSKLFKNGGSQVDVYEQGQLSSTFVLRPSGDTITAYHYYSIDGTNRKVYSTYRYRQSRLDSKTMHSYLGADSIVEKFDTASRRFKISYHIDSFKNNDMALTKDHPASFKGDINEFIRTYVKYPEVARENSISGKVMVRFVVDIDGSISQVKGDGKCHELLEKEAVRVLLKTDGMWKPAVQNGIPVKSILQIPILFQLN